MELPDDSEALKAVVRPLLLGHDDEKRRADDLHIENLRLREESDRYKKWYYGPRADRLQTAGDLAQILPGFVEAPDQTAVNSVEARSPMRVLYVMGRKPEEEGSRAASAINCSISRPL